MDKILQLKEKIKERYGKIATDGNSTSCCVPSSERCGVSSEIVLSPVESSKAVGYDLDDLKLIPESSVLGVGCGNPTRFAEIEEGNILMNMIDSNC
jgi:arsenite methyltransferase